MDQHQGVNGWESKYAPAEMAGYLSAVLMRIKINVTTDHTPA